MITFYESVLRIRCRLTSAQRSRYHTSVWHTSVWHTSVWHGMSSLEAYPHALVLDTQVLDTQVLDTRKAVSASDDHDTI